MNVYEKYGLKKVLNAYDKSTNLGGARVCPEIASVVSEILPETFELDDMQAVAGKVIADATGAEYGCVTACAAAGITLGVAAAMTGNDRTLASRLPCTDGMPSKVVIQKGHCISFGAPVTQMIRLSGANVVETGYANACSAWQIEDELAKEGVAALFAVESYHTVKYGGPALPELVDMAQKAGVPLLVDAATQELRLGEIVAMGPDLVFCSAHKYFGSTTAGVVAGRKDLVEAVLLHHSGIGRGMKAGKEAILGLVAALDTDVLKDRDRWIKREKRKIERVAALLSECPSLSPELSPDPNGCPFSRVRLPVDPEETGMTAAMLRDKLAAGDPAIHVRVYGYDRNSIYVNATELNDDEIDVVCEEIIRLLTQDA